MNLVAWFLSLLGKNVSIELLNAEVTRLTKLVAQRDRQRRQQEEVKALAAQVADLQKELGIAV